MAVAENILSSEQHLLRCVRHRGFHFPKTLPGILTEIANAGIEGSSAPGLQRPKTDLVEVLGNRQHIVDTHSGCEQALVGVS